LQAQLFTQAQEGAGIDHVYEQRLFTGGGCAFADINNDGYDDLYITGGAGSDKLYLNNQDGTFEDISFTSRIIGTANYYTSGVNVGDFDNDGHVDFFVSTMTNFEGRLAKNLLFQNLGNNTFRETWTISTPVDDVWSIGSVLLDYDSDGDLDIYVYNYIEESVLVKDDEGNTIDFDHQCYSNRMYENQGDFLFEEVTADLGLVEGGCGLAAIATDIDNDGDIDIYLGNDFGLEIEPNRLYRNDFLESGKFTEISQSIGLRKDIYCMGIAIGDIDCDADSDLYMTNYGRNVMLKNNGGQYADITDSAGVGNIWIKEDSTLAVSWGTILADVDNDMDLDLYVANGFAPSSLILPTEFLDSDHLYLNDGNGIFSEEEIISVKNNPYTCRGTAYSDYDRDGDIDIVTVVYDRPANGGGGKCILYENNGNINNWVSIKLEGLVCNRDAIGAKIRLHFGDKILIREIEGGASHTSKNSMFAHIGIGSVDQIDSIVIIWPGSFIPQTEVSVPINAYTKIIQDSSYLKLSTATSNSWVSGLTIAPNPTSDFLHIYSESEVTNLTIMSINGTILKRYKERNINFIDLSALDSGVYLLRIKTKRGVITRKVVKQ